MSIPTSKGCKGPEVGTSSVCQQQRKKARVAWWNEGKGARKEVTGPALWGLA